MDYKEVIEKLDLRDLVAPGKRYSGERPVMITCPWHEERKPSLAIFRDHAFCFGCNRRQSLLEWVAEKVGLDIARDFSQVVAAAASLAGQVIVAPPPPRRTPTPPVQIPPLDPAVARRYHNMLGEKRQWFLGRGLSNRIIDEQILGYDGKAFTIPVWHPGGMLLNIRFRRDDAINREGRKYWGIEGRNETILYNQVALVDNFGYILVTEGELDCLRLAQEGIPAVSSTNGAAGMLRIWEREAHLFLCPRIVIALDQDEAGRKAAGELRELINGRGHTASRGRAVIMKWDRRLGKDITELAQKKGVEYVRKLIEEVLG